MSVPNSPNAEAGHDGPVRHVLFSASGERFALPLSAVREVVLPQPPFARVPRASDAVRGAMNLRGRVLAVVDLAAMMGLEPQRLEGGQGQVVVLDRDKRGLGFLIGVVLGVEPFASPAEGKSSVVRGVTEVKGAAVTVLDARGLAEVATALFGGR
jgi:purine-binding chemotaxis protein CheW